ncbi:HsdR family type I site-specific deoxyribonuclease [Candidatus Calescamantes bacterium]|nr:HsdR family type I site-specific deoxyribonuclease [Candidatus Calescamantes bacterium]
MGMPEYKEVEKFLIEKLENLGWFYVPGDELGRADFKDPLIEKSVVSAIERINPFRLHEKDVSFALSKLRSEGFGHEGHKKVLDYFKHGIPVNLEKQGTIAYLKLFDFKNPENNEFIVSNQVIYHGNGNTRADVVLYVNGIPLVLIECKNPEDPASNWKLAFRQIKSYERLVPELFKFVQIGVAAEATARYFPIVPWDNSPRIYEWKEDDRDPLEAIACMLSPDRILDIIRNFFFIREEHGEITKVIARYMQYRAANRIVERVISHLNGEDDRDHGLIWHWQGSGKTLTMIFAAHKLFYAEELENPTIFFVVDRRELETQLSDEFSALHIVSAETIESINHLKKVVSHDNFKGKRGIFITLIQKFSPEKLKEVNDFVESNKGETIADRKNVILFIDEAHRNQYGIHASQMKAIFKNGFAFAFTGTPISKLYRDTYEEFAYPPEELYLDKYFITDSIREGFTLKIVYQPRLTVHHLKKDLLNAFLEQKIYDEFPEYVKEDVDKELSEKINNIKVFLEDENRIKEICRDIADHFSENLDGRFKALVVAGSRNACLIYKKYLQEFLPEHYVEVVMTASVHEGGLKGIYAQEARRIYGDSDMSVVKRKIVDSYKNKDFPRILIVTSMLLTGFDAPILKTMYLDKPLKEHRLLQAIARTNRPYIDENGEEIKGYGEIIDYVGVLYDLKKAFAIYNEEDIEGALWNIERLKEEFEQMMEEVLSFFPGIEREFEREAFISAVELLTSEHGRAKEFIDKYRTLRKLYELLGADPAKIKYLEDYKWLTGVYSYYIKLVQPEKNAGEIKKYFRRTLDLIHKTTVLEKIEKSFPELVLDAENIEKLLKSLESKKEKAAAVVFVLRNLVLVEKTGKPIYESLVEKVERLVEMWRMKVKDYDEIIKRGLECYKEAKKTDERQRKLGLSDIEYAILLKIEETTGKIGGFEEMVKQLVNDIGENLFEGWYAQETVKKYVERRIRRLVRKIKSQFGLSMEEMNDLFDKIWNAVKYYGV